MNKVLTESEARDLIKSIGIDEMEDLDWTNISENYILSEDFIREFEDYLDWYAISKYQILSESFISEFKLKLYWSTLIVYQKLSENFIDNFIKTTSKYANLNWSWVAIVMYQVLSEDFIRTHLDEMSYHEWEGISTYQTLSEDFIMEFKDKVDWTRIFLNQNISEKMESYILMNNLINENSLSKYQDYLKIKLNLKSSNSLDGKFIIGYLEMDKNFRDFAFRNDYKYKSVGQIISIKDNKFIHVLKKSIRINAPKFCKCKVYYEDIIEEYDDSFISRKVTILMNRNNLLLFRKVGSLFINSYNKSLIKTSKL